MSQNFDKNSLFMEPKTTQYGSHMIMSNVNKPVRTKYINIDTKFRDEYNYNDKSYYNITTPERYKYNITLPEIVTDVKSITIKAIEIPMTFFNISSNLENNFLNITKNSGIPTTITIADGSYNTIYSIVTKLNSLLATAFSGDITIIIDSNGNYNINSVSTNTYIIDLSPKDKYHFKSSLGWLLGFRNPIYTIVGGGKIIAENTTQLISPAPRYLYLAIDEFNKGIQNSFITPVSSAFLNKNIIARITMDSITHGYGTILPANLFNGLLISDTRSYNGKVDLKKLCLQLFNEQGMPIDLNGSEFSLSMELQHE